MYQFECPNGHKSYSASKETYDQTCPECHEPVVLVTEESQDKPTRPQA